MRSILRRLKTWFVDKILHKILHMKKGIHLYINGTEVELGSTPEILYNWAIDDVMNPSAVKNTYSKSVKIPGTENNNKIFSSIWNLSSTSFNAGKKTGFSIYIDDELYETGYARLDNFTRNNNKIEYSISLFGGLGSFFYSLAYVEDDLKGESASKKLSDLIFRYDDDETEVDFDFTINMDTIQDA